MRRRLCLLALSLLLSGCTRPPANVILIVVDTLRADHLGCYGYGRSSSPHLDRLASAGTVFDAAIAQSSWTAASVASLFTSLYPSAHGVVDFESKLSPQLETLAQVLQRRGFKTAAFSANIAFVHPDKGFAYGFDEFQVATRDARPDEKGETLFGKVPANAEEVTNHVLDYLARTGSGPFFLYVHYIDPHAPYDAPPPYHDQFVAGNVGIPQTINSSFGDGKAAVAQESDVPRLIDLYDGEIAFTDAQIGRLLNYLRASGLMEQSIVVLTSDHGEELYDHGAFGHGTTLYSEVVRVPLIVALPHADGGGRHVDTPVELVDIGPTILEELGEADDRTTQGRSLSSLLRGDLLSQQPAGEVFKPAPELAPSGLGYSELSRLMESTPNPPKHSRALRSSNWAYLRDDLGKESLYKNAEDAAELHDRSLAESKTVQDMARAAEERFRSSDQFTKPAAHDELSEKDRERLRALGYVE